MENGQLFATASGQPKLRLYAKKENYFFFKAVEAEIEFGASVNGVVEKLILYQGGQQLAAKKIK